MDVRDVQTNLPRLSSLLLGALETGNDLLEDLKRGVWTFLEPQVSHYVQQDDDPAVDERQAKRMRFSENVFVLPGEEEQLLYKAPGGVFRIPSQVCALALDELDAAKGDGSEYRFLLDAANGKWYLLDLELWKLAMWEDEGWNFVQGFPDVWVRSWQLHNDEFIFIIENEEDTALLDVWTWKLGQGADKLRKVHTLLSGKFPLMWRGQVFDKDTGECVWPILEGNRREYLKHAKSFRFWSSGRQGLNIASAVSRETAQEKTFVCDAHQNLMFPVDSDVIVVPWGRWTLGIDKLGRLIRLSDNPFDQEVFVPVYQHGLDLSRTQPILIIE